MKEGGDMTGKKEQRMAIFLRKQTKNIYSQ